MAHGYENAPIIQAISLLAFILSTTISYASAISFDLTRILTSGELWRVFLSSVIFKNTAETVVGLILLYTLRPFERQMGSKKFASFAAMSFVIGSLLLMAMVVSAQMLGVYLIPSPGPYLLIFSMLPMYHSRIPKLHASKMAGVPLSEKSWTYLLAAQLMMCDGLESMCVAAAGLLFGYLYNQDGSRLQELRLPSKVEMLWVKICSVSNIFSNIFSGRPQQQQQQQQGAALAAGGRGENLLGGHQQQQQQYMPAAPAAAMVPAPSEESITTLMGMGFDRPAVIEALRQSGNSVEAAANRLLR